MSKIARTLFCTFFAGLSFSACQQIVVNSVTKPIAPTALAATAGDGEVSLTWNAAEGATSYSVYYKAGNSATISATKATPAMVRGTTATINSLTNGREYAFVVTASNTAGESAAAAATPSATSQAITKPPAPTNLEAVSGEGQISLSWTAASGASSYNVYYKAGTTATVSDTKVAASKVSGTTATITGLTNGTQYAFVVTASNAAGESAATPQVVGPSDITGTWKVSSSSNSSSSSSPRSGETYQFSNVAASGSGFTGTRT